MNQTMSLGEALLSLHQEHLSSIEFLKGYIQLKFDGPCLTAYSMPIIQDKNKNVITASDPCYCDVLCGKIGLIVTDTEIQDEVAVRIVLEDGSQISISLESNKTQSPESLQFVDSSGGIWVA